MSAKRKTPIKERAAKAGVAIAPTLTGVRDILADEGASPAARTCAKKALRAHQMGVVMKVTRAEENAQRPPEQQTKQQRGTPILERAAKAGVQLPPAEQDKRKHQKLVWKKVARAEQQVTFEIAISGRF